MDDVEARLRRTLKDRLDPVAADQTRGEPALRRARRGRAVRGVAAGLTAVLLAGAGAAATTWERSEEDRPLPAAEPAGVATFAVDFDPGHGTVTVDVARAQICFDLSRGIRMGAQLRYGKEGAGDVGVTATSATRSAAPQCRPVDPDHAHRLLTNPAGHFVVLSPGYLTRSAGLEEARVSPEQASDTMKIVCSQDGAVAVTPYVRPQEDGIHVSFFDGGDRWKAFNLVNDGGDNEGGDLRSDGEFVSTFPPGPLYAGCFEHLDEAPYSPRDPAYTKVTIVDPDSLWTADEPDCGGADKRPLLLPRRPRELEPSDYEPMIREHVSGVRAEDVIERPRYPATEFIYETRTIVRDGRPIASVMFFPRGSQWVLEIFACPGSGIAREQRL